uniref:Enoyl reductase (ER) domain-containing protein n=1 Tax=Clastoptera arizonana TaxID=38151 RepID=A0A1B6CS42_9HEMI
MALKITLMSRINSQKLFRKISTTYSTIAAPKLQNEFEGEEIHKMAAWQIHSYGGLEELQLGRNVRIPFIQSPNEVLIKVLSSSVNPLDIAMIGGYGSTLLNKMRQLETCKTETVLEFPMTLGRDFTGEIVGKGNAVSKHFKIGDVVFGVQPPHKQGCHAQYVIADYNLIHHKPENLSIVDASCMLYTGLTAWSALQITGELCILPPKGRRILVIGASGGVGTISVQLLKAWEADVVATCRTDAVSLLKSLGVDNIIDYTQPEAMENIKSAGKYDIILDAAGLQETEFPQYIECLKDWNFAKFITLKSPLLKNTDTYGILQGMVRNAAELILPNIMMGALAKGSTLRWGYFMPINRGIKEISRLLETKQIIPVVESVMNVTELPAAYERMKNGHLRGKVVLTI